ncbi:MAG: 3-hydroxyacyl-CoA dehydrogenase family protein [Minwuia sp.]|nr:3-hydroxyacyl-CoA dehydrogenase family protein [Minwuia sp.]
MLKRVGVVGAGLMGAEIAFEFARAGYDVLLSDRSDDVLAAARTRLEGIWNKGLARSFYAEGDGSPLDRMQFDADLASFADREIVVEAVFEDEAVKGEAWARLDGICGPEAIFCTNTSTIAISTLAAHVDVARRPRFVGTHFFSPVTRMKLVEVMPGFETDEAVVEEMFEHLKAAAKHPIRIKDVTGFAVNRLLHVFMIEAVRLVEEGVATPEDIDTACKLGLGHPIGPFELMDAVTLSLCEQAQEIMHASYGERFRPRPLLKQKVRAGHNGRKTGQGWKTYD